MKPYDFDEPVPRRGTASLKWDDDPREDLLPMWVADMDFRTAPCILAALARRVGHGIFGYALPPQSYYDSIREWFSRRHGWAPAREWILPTTGVIPALAAILRALTRPGDRILLQTPVYNHFFISVKNAGCTAEESPLLLCDNTCRIDFETFGQRIGVLPKKMTTVLDLFTQEQPEVYALIDRSFLDEKVKRMYKRSYQERLSRLTRR